MAKEHRCQAPRLCVNNCGFFGSPATQNLCSKCFLFHSLVTLNDSFLADPDELSDNEEEFIDEDDGDTGKMDEDVDGDMAGVEVLNYDDSKLQKTERYNDIMKKVDDVLEKGSWTLYHGTVLGDDPQYQLIVYCNALLVDIENEIVVIHNFIRDKYRLKFPELESLVHHP